MSNRINTWTVGFLPGMHATAVLGQSASVPYIIDRGPNSRSWASTVAEQTPLGDTVLDTNLTHEVCSGLYYRTPNGWQLSDPTLKILPDRSGAVALRGQHQAFFPADIYEGMLAISLASGEVIHKPVRKAHSGASKSSLPWKDFDSRSCAEQTLCRSNHSH